MSRRAAIALATSATMVIAGGVAVAVDRSGGAADDQTAVAPLSAAAVKALAADRGLVVSLPTALAEVPQAAADLAGVDRASAQGDLAAVPALRSLVAAVGGHSSAVTQLVATYRAALTSSAPEDVSAAPGELDELQSIEGEVLPAVRLVALRHGRHVSAADALAAVERDSRTPELGRLLADWSAIYGAFLLLEQEVLSAAS